MHPVEIDIIGLQPPQGRLAIRKNALTVRSASVGIAALHIAAELRRDDGAIPLRCVPADMVADDPLGMATGVNVGGIDEITAGLTLSPERPRVT
jgi:hypothetical protein